MKRIIFLMVLLTSFASICMAQKIGFLMDSYITDRWYLDKKFLTERIQSLGGECIVEIPYGNADEQVNLAKKLIDNKVDVLIVVASNTEKALDIVAMAKKANIPVISYDRLILTKDIAYYISFDNEKVGEIQAQYALDRVPQGNYVLINGPTSDYNGILFRQGQLKVLEPHIKSGKVKLILDHVLSDWSEMEAMMKVSESFSGNVAQPDVIIAANDAIANGAILSLHKDQLGKVLITGQDSDVVGLKNVLAGNQTMTIYKSIRSVATRAAEVAMELAKTKTVANGKKMKFGDLEVMAELLPAIAVDKSNYMDTVIKDGQVQLSDITGKN